MVPITDRFRLDEAFQLYKRIASVRLPTKEDWQVGRTLKAMFQITKPLEWPSLVRTIDLAVAASNRAIFLQERPFIKVGRHIFWRDSGGFEWIECQVVSIASNFAVIIRLFDSGRLKRKTITVHPSGLYERRGDS